MKAPEPAERVQVGRVIGLWGVQGWLRIFSDTQPSDEIFSYQPWFLGPDSRPIRILNWRRQGPRLMVQVEGITDPDQAAKLIEQPIEVRRDCFPTPESDSYYWSDLQGLEVVNLQDHCYGTVYRLIETGANDVLDIRDDSGESTLIPFVSGQFVHEVDFSSRSIKVDWPLEWTQ